MILLGISARTPRPKFTPGGVSVSNFTLATNRRWKDAATPVSRKEETEWHRCVLWRSENRANYLTKGTNVYVEGRLQTEKLGR